MAPEADVTGSRIVTKCRELVLSKSLSLFRRIRSIGNVWCLLYKLWNCVWKCCPDPKTASGHGTDGV